MSVNNFKEPKNKSALSTRWAQMTKQEQIIEKKKMEIQAKLEAQKNIAALAAQAKLNNPENVEEKGSSNIFSNDGSFMRQYKALLEKQNKEKREKEERELQEQQEKNEELQKKKIESVQKLDIQPKEGHYVETKYISDRRSEREDSRQRDRHHRWSDRSRNRAGSPFTAKVEDKMNSKVMSSHDTNNIPSLMQISVMPPDDQSPSNSCNKWNYGDESDSNENYDRKVNQDYDDYGSDSAQNDSDQVNTAQPVSESMNSMQMGPGSMGPGLMGPGPMGPGIMGFGHMGPGPMGPGPMGPGLMGPGPMNHIPMGMGPMGPGPMGPMQMGPRPMGPGPMGSNSMGPGLGPMGGGPLSQGQMGSGANVQNMGPGNPNIPPMPFMGGPPNFAMPPNFIGPNGGPCGPGSMPPNICGPNMLGPGPNGSMPPFFPPNGPPTSMMPPITMSKDTPPFMGPQQSFGHNGPNFSQNSGPSNMGLSNIPFMPPNSINSMPIPPLSMEETKPMDKMAINPPPLPPMMPKKIETNVPPPSNIKVLSADTFQSSVQRAAAEVASNGDHWENVLKAMHSQDQSMWFLHNTNSNEYKMYRDLVNKTRKERDNKREEIKPEDKYEPEFSLEDDDSNDYKIPKEENVDSNYYSNCTPYQHNSNMKREAGGSQSDDDSDSKRERRKKRKSRWGDDPPADIRPSAVMPPFPPLPPLPPLPGPKLSKIDEDGIKLSTINRNNQALMQYAMTNYGTTNLNADDWKKCEDNFKLNLLFQDMLKKRQEVERLNAAGKHKYEYDSDEDTAEGTWEHKLRAKEMNATERWADELTKQAAGKHHIGDFLPPEELKKFMEKYSAVKSGKEPDLSDYKEYKLREDNIGFKMLQKLGWNEGQGLGAEGTGIMEPVNKANQPVANLGLGAKTSDVVSSEDDEFDAYRKRMMLAYRFRPNPLNNPRRPYY